VPRTKGRSIIGPTIQIQNWPAGERARAITMEIKKSPNNLRIIRIVRVVRGASLLKGLPFHVGRGESLGI